MQFVTEVLTYAAMAKETPEMLTARQFAKRAGVAYPTVIKWLKENLIPGAEMKKSVQFGNYWDIPATSLKSVTKRKPGPKKGSKRMKAAAGASTKTTRGAAKKRGGTK
jgi:hypothetical protein